MKEFQKSSDHRPITGGLQRRAAQVIIFDKGNEGPRRLGPRQGGPDEAASAVLPVAMGCARRCALGNPRLARARATCDTRFLGSRRAAPQPDSRPHPPSVECELRPADSDAQTATLRWRRPVLLRGRSYGLRPRFTMLSVTRSQGTATVSTFVREPLVREPLVLCWGTCVARTGDPDSGRCRISFGRFRSGVGRTSPPHVSSVRRKKKNQVQERATHTPDREEDEATKNAERGKTRYVANPGDERRRTPAGPGEANHGRNKKHIQRARPKQRRAPQKTAQRQTESQPGPNTKCMVRLHMWSNPAETNPKLAADIAPHLEPP